MPTNRLSKIDTPPLKPIPSQPLHHPQTMPSLQSLANDTSQLYIGLPPPPRMTADGAESPSMSPYGWRPPMPGRPQTPPSAGNLATLTPPESPSSAGVKKRRSWLPSSRKTSRSDEGSNQFLAWIAGQHGRARYDASQLVHGMPVPELWDESGDTLIYLFPESYGMGPSFKTHSSIYSSSTALTRLGFGALYSHKNKKSRDISRKPLSGSSLSNPQDADQSSGFGDHSSSGSSRRSQTDEFSARPNGPVKIHLNLSLKTDPSTLKRFPAANISATDLDTLVTTRNMFAFLLGQSLIATDQRTSLFSIFMGIADALKCYGFTNLDGSTFGEIATSSFENYVEELHLNDVRTSREKTLEALILGERMRSVMLYNEGFTHAVGRYDDLQAVRKFPSGAMKFDLVSSVTLNRMERAAFDLSKREEKVKLRLADFDIPSLWAGIVISKVADEGKILRFQAWKENFMWMRKHVVAYYKEKFGAWPPKATAKNDIEISGLNRLALRTLYRDFSALYDLFVDKTSLTTRTSDGMPSPSTRECTIEDSAASALRKIEDEFDHSIPPVQPPIPYDLPKLPTVTAIGKDPRDFNARTKKLSQNELGRVLQNACNHDSLQEVAKSPFVQATLHWESKAAKGSSVSELLDLRAGIWLFTYVVLNSLPMLVVDAPGVQHTAGVEYFLCEPPRSGVPWANSQSSESARSKNTWYGIAGGAGVVNLPSDLIEHGVEGVYRRSHCWQMARKWNPDSTGGQQRVSDGGHPDFNSARTSLSQDSHSSNRGRPQIPPVINEPPSQQHIFDPGYSIQHSSFTPPTFPRSRTPSPAPPHGYRESVLALGLEALPLPAGVTPAIAQQQQHQQQGQRSSSQPRSGKGSSNGGERASSATFDDIFASMDKKGKGSKEKKNRNASK